MRGVVPSCLLVLVYFLEQALIWSSADESLLSLCALMCSLDGSSSWDHECVFPCSFDPIVLEHRSVLLHHICPF